jgi:hypothetical protein
MNINLRTLEDRSKVVGKMIMDVFPDAHDYEGGLLILFTDGSKLVIYEQNIEGELGFEYHER